MFRRMPRLRYLQPPGYKVAAQGVTTASCVCHARLGEPDVYARTFSWISSIYSKVRAPICFNPVASRTVLPCRSCAPGSEWKARHRTKLPKGSGGVRQRRAAEMETVAFAYMFSADQDLGPGVGPWHPHMMLLHPVLRELDAGR